MDESPRPKRRAVRRRRAARPVRWAFVAAAGLAIAGAALTALAPSPEVLVPDAGDRSPRASIHLAFESLIPAQDATPLVRPVGVAVGGGRIYVADAVDGVVRVFDRRGRDGGSIGRGLLEIPTYVTRDPRDGSILVSDRRRREILRFASEGTPLGSLILRTPPTDAGEGTPIEWEPLGIDVTNEGAVYAADVSGTHRVVVFGPDGSLIAAVGGSFDAPDGATISLDFPNVVRVREGTVWVADSNNRRVLAFGPDGALTLAARMDGVVRGFDFVEGAVDDGAEVGLLVCDALASEIVLLAPDGEELDRFGGPGAGGGQLAYPNDLRVESAEGLVYIADTGNARVQVWRIMPGDPPAPDSGERVSRMHPMRVAGIVLLALSLLPLVAGLAALRRGKNGRNLVEL